MDKLLMFANRDLDDECSGITRKVISQYNALSKSFDVYLVGRSKNNIIIINNGKRWKTDATRLTRFKKIISACKQLIRSNDIKFIYFRRQPCTPKILNFFSFAKQNGVKKIVWEIPTYPYDTEKTSIAGRMRRQIDKMCRYKLIKYADKIVTFSPDKKIFGIDTINTGNGIDVNLIRERKIEDHGDEIHLIAAAVLRDWHGYDRLIKGIAKYNGNRKIVFHLIGDGPCLKEYKELVSKYGIEKNVIFYGYMKKEQMDDIYDKCDMAVESLGWHRSGVSLSTSIKVREYIAKGLPVLASTPIDMFPNGWKYAYYAPIDESPIRIDEVIQFYDSLFQNVTKQELAKTIRQIAFEKCEMSNMMNPVIEFLKMN